MPWTKSGFPMFKNWRERAQFWRKDPYRLPHGMPLDKFPDLTEDHIWGPLHDRYNTAPMVIMDKTAWHTDVTDVIRNSNTVEEVHTELEKRRKLRLDECIAAIEGSKCADANTMFRAKSARRRRMRAAQIDELSYKITTFYRSGSMTDAAFLFLHMKEIWEAESKEDDLEKAARNASEKKALEEAPIQPTTSLIECMTNGDAPARPEGAPTMPDCHSSTMEHGVTGTNKRKRDDSDPKSSCGKRPRVTTPSTDDGTNVTGPEAPSSAPVISENLNASISGDKHEDLESKSSQNTKSQAITPAPRDEGYSAASLGAFPSTPLGSENDKVPALFDTLEDSESKSSHRMEQQAMASRAETSHSVTSLEATLSVPPMSESDKVATLDDKLEDLGSKSSHDKEHQAIVPPAEAGQTSPSSPISKKGKASTFDDKLEYSGSTSSPSQEQQAMTPPIEAGDSVANPETSPSAPISKNSKTPALDDELEDSGSQSSHDRRHRVTAPPRDAGDGAKRAESPLYSDTSPSTASEDEEDAEEDRLFQKSREEAIRYSRQFRQLPRDQWPQTELAPTDITWQIRGFRFLGKEPKPRPIFMKAKKPIPRTTIHKMPAMSLKTAQSRQLHDV